MNLSKIKFEKVNMKIVVAAGACVIAILTAIFIVVRTNLIIDHSNSDKNNNPETEDNSNNKPNNPSNPDGEPGDNEEPPSTPGSGDDSNDNGDSQQKPNYDDPEEEDDDENKISKSVKNRTKKAENLTVKEKEYILQDNVTKKVTKNKSMRTTCVKDSFCAVKVKNYTTYSTDEKIGKNITGCSGNIIFYYNSKKKEVVYDMQDVKCK